MGCGWGPFLQVSLVITVGPIGGIISGALWTEVLVLRKGRGKICILISWYCAWVMANSWKLLLFTALYSEPWGECSIALSLIMDRQVVRLCFKMFQKKQFGNPVDLPRLHTSTVWEDIKTIAKPMGWPSLGILGCWNGLEDSHRFTSLEVRGALQCVVMPHESGKSLFH